MPNIDPHIAKTLIDQSLAQLNQIILGKEKETKLALCCVLAQGHLLIEDIPGMGKTTLSHALARTLGLKYKRAQFTSDMLPADIIGGNIFDKNSGKLLFQRGPIFSNIVLADEINRAPPKTQSAMLEAMEEKRVSIDGRTRDLASPFVVIATQNPVEQSGTYPLPESQLDRFMMRISLGYPSEEDEKALLTGKSRTTLLESVSSLLNEEQVIALQEMSQSIQVPDKVIDYVFRLAKFSRELERQHGLSPRANLSLIAAARAWAFLNHRETVIPDDIQDVFPYICDHRMPHSHSQSQKISNKILNSVDIF